MRKTIALLTFAAALAVPGTAFAKGGPGGGGATPPPAPTPTSAPTCITIVPKGSGVTVHKNLPSPTFQVTNCGTGALTLVPHYVDQATDAWPLNRDCGPAATWTAAPVSIAAAKTATISTFSVRGGCPAAEFHQISVTFTTPAGAPIAGTSSFYWVDSIKP
jgi:hypothetical protein